MNIKKFFEQLKQFIFNMSRAPKTRPMGNLGDPYETARLKARMEKRLAAIEKNKKP